MIGTIIAVALLAAYAVVWIACSVVIVRHEDYGGNDSTDTFLLALLAFITGIFWPLAGPVLLILWLAKRETLAERRERRALERDQAIRERDRRIAQLERELGIGATP